MPNYGYGNTQASATAAAGDSTSMEGDDPDAGRCDPTAPVTAAPAKKQLATISGPRPTFAPTAVRRKRPPPSAAAGSGASAATRPRTVVSEPKPAQRPVPAGQVQGAAKDGEKDAYSAFMAEMEKLG